MKMNILRNKYVYNLLFLLCTRCICIDTLGNNKKQILKRRVVERQAHQKAGSLLDQFKSNNMQELVDSLQNMNKLLTTLQVSSIDLAIQKVETMQNDLQKILAALNADSISAGIKQAKQIRSVVEQLSQLQTKIALP
jgi:hypothetical protein